MIHFPNRSGSSLQGDPVRITHKIPSMASRLSFPDRPWSPTLPGSKEELEHRIRTLETKMLVASRVV